MAGAGGAMGRFGSAAAVVLLAGALVAGVAAPAGASTATVTKLADTDGTCDPGDCSLREAIDSGAELITFTSGLSGMIDLFEELPHITSDLTIQGPGAETVQIRRQGGEFFRIFTVEGGVTAEISGLTIWNGGATPGGGILSGSALQNSTLTLRNVIVTGNSGGAGGGIASYGTLTVENSTIEHNTATTNAGGGGIRSFGALTVRNSTVANNSTPSSTGGGIRVHPPSQPLPGATARVERSTFTENSGGGIRNAGAELLVTDTTLHSNSSPVGGGVSNEAGSTTVERSTLTGNSACNQYWGGGGLYVSGGSLTVRNSTVTGNTSCSWGGGIHVSFTGSLVLHNSTVASNQAMHGANLGANADGVAQVRSSILAHPQGSTNCATGNDGVITSQGYNLADDPSCGFNAPADQPVANALLAPLADNGGPTQTMALGEGSPAIDQGIAGGLTTDQRGRPRPIDFPDIPNAPGGDGTDIGAFEVEGPDDDDPDDPGDPGDPGEACPDDLPSGGFTDTVGNVHAHNIDCIVWWEITFGIAAGHYGPTNPVTRAQIASFIARLIENAGGTLPVPSDQGFTDIAGNTHADRINQLAAAGIVQGTSPTTYNPGATVRRDQMTTFLVRAYHHLTGTTLPVTQTYFNDIAGNVHEDNINAAAEAGFALGTGPGTFSPGLDVRRDQMASFLARVLERLVTEGHATPPG